MSSKDRALQFIGRKWKPVPIPAGQKGPRTPGWNRLNITEADVSQHFSVPGLNVGILLGQDPEWVVDVDLDVAEAVELAPDFLPPTGYVFGRQSKQRSHWVYYSRGARTIKLEHNGATTVELRSSGLQTVFPGSTHPSGEAIQCAIDGEPATVDATAIEQAVYMLGEATRLVRSGWPRAAAIAVAREGRPEKAPAAQERIRTESTFSDAVAKYNAEHRQDYPRANGECPACGHDGCFGRLGDTSDRWACFSSAHTEPGIRGQSCYHGDALDLASFAAGATRAELLRRGGYLTVATSSPLASAPMASVPSSPAALIEPFPTITYSGLPSAARWLFPQLIEQGTCAVLGAEPKAGKSWITFDMAIALATGERLLGDFSPAERGTTLFYSPEGSARSRHGRLVGLCWGRGVHPDLVLPSIHFLDAQLDLNVEDHAARLGATIDAVGARLVVVDPMVSAAMGIDENASGDVMKILNPLRAVIKDRPNCALVVVHHTNKMARGQAMSLGLRGSSAIMGWLDTLITIRRAEDDSSGPRRVDIAHRDAGAPEPLGFQLAYGSADEAPGLQWFRLTRCEVPNIEGKRAKEDPIADAVSSALSDGAWHSGTAAADKAGRRKKDVFAELHRQALLGSLEHHPKLGYRAVPGTGTANHGNYDNDE